MSAGNALTPSFVFDLESRMRVIQAKEYQRLTSDLYYTQFTKELSSTGKRERLIWLLETASIDYVDRLGGTVEFEELVSNTKEIVNKAATAGLKLNRSQLEDLDGGGIEQAASWSRQVGAYMAYFPQEKVMEKVRDGTQAASKSYDGEIFFSKSHPLNPFDSVVGTYSNLFSGGSGSGAFDKAPIDESVDLEDALSNLNRVVASIRKIKMPNGKAPRKLRPKGLLVPPDLTARAQQLTNAKFIAQAAGSGAGSGDITGVIANLGLAGAPIVADELASVFTNGSDTTYYVIAEQLGGDELGAIVYQNRKPFEVTYNSPMTDADLARADELQWVVRGRNVVDYGHPYLLFRVEAS